MSRQDPEDFELEDNQDSDRRLTLGRFRKGLPRYHRAVKYVAAYAVFGYIIVMILFLAVWCRPVNWYWKVPVPNCMYPSVPPDTYPSS